MPQQEFVNKPGGRQNEIKESCYKSIQQGQEKFLETRLGQNWA